ncbi:MAG: DUF7550 family protein [Halodesulfurarchaeum sp.]
MDRRGSPVQAISKHSDTAKWVPPVGSSMTEPDETADEADERVTAPMQSYGSGEVTIGFVVLAIGLLITFLLPLAL